METLLYSLMHIVDHHHLHQLLLPPSGICHKFKHWDAAKLLITCLKNREEFNSSTFLRDKLAKGISASSTRRL